jgi:hypothetical protein
MPQKGGYSDATSSFMPQKGGYSDGTKNKDINKLLSMLSDTSHDNYTANSINTEQDGGSWFTDLFKTKEELSYDINMPSLLNLKATYIQTSEDYKTIKEQIINELYKVYSARKGVNNIKLEEVAPIKKIIERELEMTAKWDAKILKKIVLLKLKEKGY